MKRAHLLLPLLFLAFLVSCTVTNRKYIKGYYVDWASSGQNKPIETKNLTSIQNNTSTILINPLVIANDNSEIQTKTAPVTKVIPIAKSSLPSISKSKKQIIFFSSAQKSDYSINPIDSAANKNKDAIIHPDSKRSLRFGLLSWATVILIFLSAVALQIYTLIFFFLLGIVLAIMGLIFGINALNSIKNEPNKYWGKGKAIAGIIFSAIFLIAAIILVAQLHF
jgi:hypothetical protein